MTDTPLHKSVPQRKVPSEWPPICTSPEVETRRLSNPLAIVALVGLWFFPKRLGPVVAAANWRATMIAHTLGVCLGLSLIAWAEHISSIRSMFRYVQGPGWPILPFSLPTPIYGDATGLEWLRSPFCALVASAHGSSGFVVRGLTLPWAFVGLELAVVVMTFVAGPFVAAGESKRRLLARSVKLSLWSTTMLIPLGVMWMCDPYARLLLQLPDEWHALDFVVLALFAVWWLAVLLRSGATYVGPAEGPLWEARSPRCESCGYSIVLLDVAGRCPECGRAVAMSMADRRVVPQFAGAVGFVGKAKGLFSTMRRAATEKAFFDGLATHRGFREARVFFILVAALGSGFLSAALCLSGVSAWGGVYSGSAAADIVVVACLLLFVQIAIAAGLVWFLAVVGKRELCSAGTVVFYGWAGVFFAALSIVFVLVGVFVLEWATAAAFGFVVRYAVGVVVAAALVGVAITVRSSVRVVRTAVRDTRFANG